MPDARDTLSQYLRPFGLDQQDVINAAWQFVQDNPTLADNSEMIVGATRNTDTYKRRFAGNAERVRRGLPELDPGTYLQYEEAYRRALRSAGMPVGFYDTEEDFSKFIGRDIDDQELTTRLEKGYKAVTQADPQIVAELKRLYMVDDASLAAFFIDPTKARDVVVRQSEAAQIAAQARTQASMALTVQEAERLSQQGISPEDAQQQFAALGQTQQLFTPLQGEDQITREEQLAAVGGNAAAAQRIATRRRQRQAAFEAGGGVVETKEGMTGLRTVGQ